MVCMNAKYLLTNLIGDPEATQWGELRTNVPRLGGVT